MIYSYQRKSLRFAKGRGIKVTTANGPVSILGPAISGTGLVVITGVASLSGATPDDRNSFTTMLTADSWELLAVNTVADMWDTLARCTQCLADNRLTSTP